MKFKSRVKRAIKSIKHDFSDEGKLEKLEKQLAMAKREEKLERMRKNIARIKGKQAPQQSASLLGDGSGLSMFSGFGSESMVSRKKKKNLFDF